MQQKKGIEQEKPQKKITRTNGTFKRVADLQLAALTWGRH